MKKFYSLIIIFSVLSLYEFCFALESFESETEWYSWDSSGAPDVYQGLFDPSYFEGILSMDYIKISDYNGRTDVINYLNSDGMSFHLNSKPELTGFLFDLKYTYFKNESTPSGILVWDDNFIWDSRVLSDPWDSVNFSLSDEGNGWMTDYWRLAIYQDTETDEVNIRILFEDFQSFHLDRFYIKTGYCIPVPGSIWMFGTSLAGLWYLRKHKRREQENKSVLALSVLKH